MTFQFLGPHPLEKQISEALRLLSAGRSPAEIETTQVEIKEEPGRRRGAEVVGGSDTNEPAAAYLAGEMACLANTEGGGAIILGVADDGTRIGSDLNAQWLRHRIYELTERKLTVDVREALVDEFRLLVIATHEAIEPIRYRGRLQWRVNDNCVEVDPSTWHAGRLHRSGFDWSGQPSGHTMSDISPVAAEIASRYLRQRGGPSDLELAEASVPDLVRRLNLADAEGILNNAGSLLFVATPHIGLDYLRRDVPGGDSRQRVRGEGPLLLQIYETEQAATVANPTVHVAQGFVHSQIRIIPPRALREAIVNGVVHRDWQTSQPTTVEHVGETLTVTSPGGFLGGINPLNIISHPAVPRYRCLAEATAALGIAERQGIGIARMTRDLLALGRPCPEIAEIDGPYVRVSLLGGEPDPALIRLVLDLAPPELAESVDALLLIDSLCARGWVNAEVATEVLQRPIGEAAQAIDRLAAAQLGDTEAAAGPYLITKVAGAGSLEPTAYRLSNESRQRIGHRCIWLHSLEGHNQLPMDWAGHRGRVSSTEAADLLNVSIPTAGRRLAALAEEGLLKTSRANGTGRGFHYLPTIT